MSRQYLTANVCGVPCSDPGWNRSCCFFDTCPRKGLRPTNDNRRLSSKWIVDDTTNFHGHWNSKSNLRSFVGPGSTGFRRTGEASPRLPLFGHSEGESETGGLWWLTVFLGVGWGGTDGDASHCGPIRETLSIRLRLGIPTTTAERRNQCCWRPTVDGTMRGNYTSLYRKVGCIVSTRFGCCLRLGKSFAVWAPNVCAPELRHFWVSGSRLVLLTASRDAVLQIRWLWVSFDSSRTLRCWGSTPKLFENSVPVDCVPFCIAEVWRNWRSSTWRPIWHTRLQCPGCGQREWLENGFWIPWQELCQILPCNQRFYYSFDISLNQWNSQ